MTTIADQDDFNKAHKRQRTYKACPPELIEKYRGRLPDLLVDTWVAFGFQNFSDGFLWSVNPDEFRELISNFLYDFQGDRVDVMFRTAFGDMLISYKGKLINFSAATMRHSNLPDSLEAVLGLHLGQPTFLDSIFFFDLFKKALKKLGPLTYGKQQRMQFLETDVAEYRNYSDETARFIDTEIMALVMRARPAPEKSSLKTGQY